MDTDIHLPIHYSIARLSNENMDPHYNEDWEYWDESKRDEVIARIFERFDTCGGKVGVHDQYGAESCPTVAADCTADDNGEGGFLKIKNYANPLGRCSDPVWSDPDTCVDDADCYGDANRCERVAEYTEECLVWDPFADHPMHTVPEGDPENEKCPPFPWDDAWEGSQRCHIGNMAPGSHPKEGIWDGVYVSTNMYPFDVGRNYQGCVNYPNPVFAHLSSCDSTNGPGLFEKQTGNTNPESNMQYCLDAAGSGGCFERLNKCCLSDPPPPVGQSNHICGGKCKGAWVRRCGGTQCGGNNVLHIEEWNNFMCAMGCAEEPGLRFRVWLDRCAAVHQHDCHLYDPAVDWRGRGVTPQFLLKEFKRRIVNSTAWFNFGMKCVVRSKALANLHARAALVDFSASF